METTKTKSVIDKIIDPNYSFDLWTKLGLDKIKTDNTVRVGGSTFMYIILGIIALILIK